MARSPTGFAPAATTSPVPIDANAAYLNGECDM